MTECVGKVKCEEREKWISIIQDAQFRITKLEHQYDALVSDIEQGSVRITTLEEKSSLVSQTDKGWHKIGEGERPLHHQWVIIKKLTDHDKTNRYLTALYDNTSINCWILSDRGTFSDQLMQDWYWKSLE